MTNELNKAPPAHTPLPWKLHDGGAAITDSEGRLISSCYQVPKRTLFEEKANAAFIVRACNSHYELLEAVEGLLRLVDILGQSQIQNQRDRLEYRKEVLAGQAAIAKARGRV